MTSFEIGPGRCGLGQRGGASRSSRYRACVSVDRPGRPRGCRDRPAAARDAPCAWSPGSRSGHPARRAGAARMACRGASRWLPLTSPLRPGSRCPRCAMHARTSKLATSRARGAQDARLRPVDGPLGERMPCTNGTQGPTRCIQRLRLPAMRIPCRRPVAAPNPPRSLDPLPEDARAVPPSRRELQETGPSTVSQAAVLSLPRDTHALAPGTVTSG